jgi:hypothetical protein
MAGRSATRASAWAMSATEAPNRPTVSSAQEKVFTPTVGSSRNEGLIAATAAEGRRSDHRAAGLRAERQRQHSGGDRCRRARGGAARRVAGIARIDRRGRVEAGECRGRGLGERHGAERPQPRYDRRIRPRPPAGIDARAELGGHVAGVDDVLDAHRDAGERPAFRHRRLGRDAQHGPDGGVAPGDPFTRPRELRPRGRGCRPRCGRGCRGARSCPPSHGPYRICQQHSTRGGSDPASLAARLRDGAHRPVHVA